MHREMTMQSKKQYIDLKLPSIMGMGAVGPTLATLTAALYGALCMADATPPAWGYPVIMLVLSGLLAVFPVAQAAYPNWQRICLWPIATAIVFATAWGTNHGLSVGEEALSQVDMPNVSAILVPSAYAQNTDTVTTNATVVTGTNVMAKAETNDMFKGAAYNSVPFDRMDMDTKVDVPQQPFKTLPKDTWGVSWTNKRQVFLKDKEGIWWGYTLKSEKQPEPPPQMQQQVPMRGGFFRRF